MGEQDLPIKSRDGQQVPRVRKFNALNVFETILCFLLLFIALVIQFNICEDQTISLERIYILPCLGVGLCLTMWILKCVSRRGTNIRTAEIRLQFTATILHIVETFSFYAFSKVKDDPTIRIGVFFAIYNALIYAWDCVVTTARVEFDEEEEEDEAVVVDNYEENAKKLDNSAHEHRPSEVRIIKKDVDCQDLDIYNDVDRRRNNNKIVKELFSMLCDQHHFVKSQTDYIELIDFRDEIHKRELKKYEAAKEIEDDPELSLLTSIIMNILRNPTYEPSAGELTSVREQLDYIIDIEERELFFARHFFGKYSDDCNYLPTKREFLALCHLLLGVKEETQIQQFREDVDDGDIIPVDVVRRYFYNPILHRQGLPQLPLSQREWVVVKDFLTKLIVKEETGRDIIYNVFSELIHDTSFVPSRTEIIRLTAMLQDVDARIHAKDFREEKRWELLTPFEIGRRYVRDSYYEPTEDELRRLSQGLGEVVNGERNARVAAHMAIIKHIANRQYIATPDEEAALEYVLDGLERDIESIEERNVSNDIEEKGQKIEQCLNPDELILKYTCLEGGNYGSNIAVLNIIKDALESVIPE